MFTKFLNNKQWQRAIALSACLSSCGVMATASAEIVRSDDGREVKINDDGTWEYVSNDRFATTKQGRRIRLGDDGRWQVEEDADDWIAVPAKSLRLSQDTMRTEFLDAQLVDVNIESVRETKQKNSRLRTQMIFTLALSVDGVTEYVPRFEDFSISDSRGRQYPVKRIQPEKVEFSEGQKTQLFVVVDGAPRWWGVKFFRLDIKDGALVGEKTLTLTKSTAEIRKSEVNKLSWE